MLALIARFLPDLCAGFSQDPNRPALPDMQNLIGEALARFDEIALEASHERITRLGADPDQPPLLRTMLRLPPDPVIIGRAALAPLPEALHPRLAPPPARRD